EMMKRNELLFTIYQKEIEDLTELAAQNNSILILLTTPINPDVSPKKSCIGAMPSALSSLLQEVEALVAKTDYKQAYDKSRVLSLLANSSANAHYIHALVSKNMGKSQEALKSIEFAQAFDCKYR